MSIEETLDRLASNVALVAGAISTLAEAVNGTYKGKQIYAETAAPAESVPAAAKRGPGRPPKAVAAPAEVAAPSEPAPTAIAPAPAAHAAATPTAATKEQTQNALVALIKANKRDAVVKILGEHGAQSVSALAPEHYAAVYAKALAATPAA